MMTQKHVQQTFDRDAKSFFKFFNDKKKTETFLTIFLSFSFTFVYIFVTNIMILDGLK